MAIFRKFFKNFVRVDDEKFFEKKYLSECLSFVVRIIFAFFQLFFSSTIKCVK